MLELFCLNVGDGDAAVFRLSRPAQPDYVLMVDTGRPALEYMKGSRRAEALYGLKDLGITHIDRLILTHLHIDHVGGAANILRHIPVDRITLPYLPEENALWVRPPFESGEKKLIGFCHMMNLWSDLIRDARVLGIQLDELCEGEETLAPGLSMSTVFPCPGALRRQRSVLGTLYRGGAVSPEALYDAAENRNISGPLSLLEYAGRRILLTADVYAAEWEKTVTGPVDILKLPHHGDPKSMTGPLISVLHPVYVYASCQNDPAAKKDRPNAEIVRLVQQFCGNFFCTENKELPTLPASTHRWIAFRIDEGGELAVSLH